MAGNTNYAMAKNVTKGALTMEWQPIETAPKDGTPVLGYRDVDGVMATVYWTTWGGWSLVAPGGYAEEDDWEPTHWMPLPDPPKNA
jgi:hypothetical protein